MGAESIQKRLGRARNSPRVHITFDVEVGDATRKVELPFVVGVLADVSGMPEKPLPRLDQREFVDIDAESFDKVLAGAKPRLKFDVANELQNDGSTFEVKLDFKSMKDFDPVRIAERVPQLKEMVDMRRMLEDFMTMVDDNEQLEDKLRELMANPDLLNKVREDVQRRKILEQAANGNSNSNVPQVES